MQQPAVPLPTEKIRRDADSKRSTKYGCVVGSDEHHAAVGQAADRERAGAAKKLASEAKFWDKHRAAVLDAEKTLVSPNGLSNMQVGQLKAIVLSRTGPLPKAKNNKDGALLAEATAVVEKQTQSLLPPPPASLAPLGGETDSDDDAEVWACETCETEYGASELPAPDENEHLWCACSGRMMRSTD
jgi:hypothetical protein